MEFIDTLGLRTVDRIQHPSFNDLEGSSALVTGAGDHFGEQLLKELIARGVGRIIALEDPEPGLERLRRFIQSTAGSGEEIIPYYLPSTNPGIIEDHLSSYNIKWVICRGFNKLFGDTSMNAGVRELLSFISAAQFIKLINRLGCERLTLVSALRKAGLSPTERRLQVALEDYVRLLQSRAQDDKRFGIVRSPNILENENEVFRKSCKRASGSYVEAPTYPLDFTSAKNAARTIVNSYPLQRRGEIFRDASGTLFDLSLLVEQFFNFDSGESFSGLIVRTDRYGGDDFDPTRDDAGDFIETTIPNVLRLTGGAVENKGILEQLDGILDLHPFGLDKAVFERIRGLFEEKEIGQRRMTGLE
jgi:hypothetical protein